MIKLLSIFMFFTYNGLLEHRVENSNQIADVQVEFSEKPIGIEGGEPLLPKGTVVMVSNPSKSKIELYINGDLKEMNTEEVKFENLDAGTYTILIINADNTKERRTVGFTIK